MEEHRANQVRVTGGCCALAGAATASFRWMRSQASEFEIGFVPDAVVVDSKAPARAAATSVLGRRLDRAGGEEVVPLAVVVRVVIECGDDQTRAQRDHFARFVPARIAMREAQQTGLEEAVEVCDHPARLPRAHTRASSPTFRSGSPTRYSLAAFSHRSLRRTSADAPRRPASIFSRTFPNRHTGCG